MNCEVCGKEFAEGENAYKITEGFIRKGEFYDPMDVTVIRCEGCP